MSVYFCFSKVASFSNSFGFHMFLRLLFIFITLVFSIQSNAQSVSVPLGTNPIIGGVSVSCLGFPTWVDNRINDLAIAWNGNIFIQPSLFNLPPVVQVFVYMHECAHQLPVINSNENAADCWAIKVGRDQGWINPQSLSLIQGFFSNTPGDWTHLPGYYRIQQMQACYMTP